MSEYALFKCNQCGIEEVGPMGGPAPEGWLQIRQLNEEAQHFCSHACLVLYGHEQADYRMMPRADRLRTALQSLGMLPRPSARE